MTKRLFIKTYGCQMNVYDSARMSEMLAPFGYAAAAGAEVSPYDHHWHNHWHNYWQNWYNVWLNWHRRD